MKAEGGWFGLKESIIMCIMVLSSFIIAGSPISDSSGHQKKAINARSENMSLSFRQGRQSDELNNVGDHFTTFR